MDPEQERQKLWRLARLRPSDGEYKALCYELQIDYERGHGREGTRQKLEGLLRLYRRQVDKEVERDLRQHEQRRPPPPEPSPPPQAQSPHRRPRQGPTGQSPGAAGPRAARNQRRPWCSDAAFPAAARQRV